MKRLLQKLKKTVLFRQRKGSIQARGSVNRQGSVSGFTLIELLVSALIASVMVAVLLSFLVAVLDSDRKETAKSNAQEEVQAAMSYIADDLQEAVYIYGSEALAIVNDQLPHRQTTSPSDVCNTTTANNCTPVLVFWKRYVYNPSAIGTYSTGGTDKIGCMPYLNKTACNASPSPFGGDRYTYSLVAYYLKRDTGSTTWSNTARILRWELKDGYVAYCSTSSTSGTRTIGTDATCPASTQVLRRDDSPLITVGGVGGVGGTALVDPNQYFILPSTGFQRPDFVSSGTLSSLAGAWKKFANFTFNTNPFVTLVDFIDDTEYSAAPAAGKYSSDGNAVATGNGTASTAAIKIPIGKNSSTVPPTNLDCNNPSIGVGQPTTGGVTQRIPDDFSSTTLNPSGLSSFYACVAPESVTARIYIRGNAIARLTTPTADRDSFIRQPTLSNLTFFPTANTRAFGRSAIGLKTK